MCAVALCVVAIGTRTLPVAADGKKKPKGAVEIERYPPSWRIKVQDAIDEGVLKLKLIQRATGHWGNPEHQQALGHTALPLLTLLKAGVPADDPQVVLALKAVRKMKLDRVYSVGIYMMVIQALYQPKLDTMDTDVGKARHKRIKPKKIYKQLAEVDRAALEAGAAYLRKSQNASGLWHYDIKADGTAGHDLSNAQYALLGLRAAADCGVKIPASVWHDALAALLIHQDTKGPKVELLEERIRGKYVMRSKLPAMARGFHYSNGMKNGPLGEKTVWSNPATGSMTTAGVAGVAICMEGLWRSRKFRGADRKRAREAIQDGLAWMQTRFTVTENPGHPRKRHHLYYLYGLERMGMLVGRRWLGTHDWYKEGADVLLEMQQGGLGWGQHVPTSFAVLFLKRATRKMDTPVITGN